MMVAIQYECTLYILYIYRVLLGRVVTVVGKNEEIPIHTFRKKFSDWIFCFRAIDRRTQNELMKSMNFSKNLDEKNTYLTFEGRHILNFE